MNSYQFPSIIGNLLTSDFLQITYGLRKLWIEFHPMKSYLFPSIWGNLLTSDFLQITHGLWKLQIEFIAMNSYQFPSIRGNLLTSDFPSSGGKLIGFHWMESKSEFSNSVCNLYIIWRQQVPSKGGTLMGIHCIGLYL